MSPTGRDVLSTRPGSLMLSLEGFDEVPVAVVEERNKEGFLTWIELIEDSSDK
jgi:hypothetical protein